MGVGQKRDGRERPRVGVDTQPEQLLSQQEQPRPPQQPNATPAEKEAGPRGILDLPIEILETILRTAVHEAGATVRRSNKKSVAEARLWCSRRLSRVCRQFHEVAAPWLFRAAEFPKRGDCDRVDELLDLAAGHSLLHANVVRLTLLPRLGMQDLLHAGDEIAAYDKMIQVMSRFSRLTHLALGDVLWDRWEEYVGVVRIPNVRSVKMIDGDMDIEHYRRLFRGGLDQSIFPNLEELCLLIWTHQAWEECVADCLIEILQAHPRLRRLRILMQDQWKHWNSNDLIRPMIQPLRKLCAFVPDSESQGHQQLQYLRVVIQEGSEYNTLKVTQDLNRALQQELADVAIPARHRKDAERLQKLRKDAAPIDSIHDQRAGRPIDPLEQTLRKTGFSVEAVPREIDWPEYRVAQMYRDAQIHENRAWFNAEHEDPLYLFA